MEGGGGGWGWGWRAEVRSTVRRLAPALRAGGRGGALVIGHLFCREKKRKKGLNPWEPTHLVRRIVRRTTSDTEKSYPYA